MRLLILVFLILLQQATHNPDGQGKANEPENNNSKTFEIASARKEGRADNEQQPTKVPTQGDAYDAGKDTLYRAYLWGTIVGVAGGCVGVVVLICQTVLTRRSANAAKASADSLKAVERPWLVAHEVEVHQVSVPDGEHVIAVKWSVRNYGKSPALVEKIEGNVDVVPAGYEFPVFPGYMEPRVFFDKPIIPPSENSHEIVNVMDRDWEKPSEWHEMVSGKVLYIASGRILYKDPFGEQHETRFCLRFDYGSYGFNYPVGPKGYNECT